MYVVKVFFCHFNGLVFQYYFTACDFAYQFFLFFPLENTYKSFKSNLQHVKLLKETFKKN